MMATSLFDFPLGDFTYRYAEVDAKYLACACLKAKTCKQAQAIILKNIFYKPFSSLLGLISTVYSRIISLDFKTNS